MSKLTNVLFLLLFLTVNQVHSESLASNELMQCLEKQSSKLKQTDNQAI